MSNWIAVVALYALGMGFFRWLGGISAAASAISRWGRAASERHRAVASSS